MATDEDDEGPRGLPWGYGPTVPLVVPARTVFVSVPGDSVHTIGNPDHLRSDAEGRYYDPQSFVIPQRIPFGPLIEQRFISVGNLRDADWANLEKLLGVAIPVNERELIDAANELFVNSVALSKQMAAWKRLGDLLGKLGPAARHLLRIMNQMRPHGEPKGALSAEQTIGTYVALALPDPPYGFDRLTSDLANVALFAEAASRTTRVGAGTGKQAELRLFLKTLCEVAGRQGVALSLLGHDEYERDDPTAVPAKERSRKAFFKFVREILRLASIYGGPGIRESGLPQEDRNTALKALEEYAKKGDVALNKQLDRLRADIWAVNDLAASAVAET